MARQPQPELTAAERVIRDLGRLAWTIVGILTAIEAYLAYIIWWQITQGNRNHAAQIIPPLAQDMAWIAIVMGLVCGATFALRAWLIHREHVRR